MKSKLFNSILAIGIGLSSLIGYELSAVDWEAETLIVGKFKKEFGDNKLYGLTIETVNGDYMVYVINCNKHPISGLLKEIKIGDYLEIKCGLTSDKEKELDCFTDSCLIKKLTPNIPKGGY